MSVLEFDDSADVARAQLVGRRSISAIENVNLAEALGDFPVAVEKVLADVNGTGIHPKK